MAERHRLRLSVDGRYGHPHAELICPTDGCEHPVNDGEVDTSVRCWLETWAEADDLMDYLADGEQALGEWEIDVEAVGDGEPRISLRSRPSLSISQIDHMLHLFGEPEREPLKGIVATLRALRNEMTKEDGGA